MKDLRDKIKIISKNLQQIQCWKKNRISSENNNDLILMEKEYHYKLYIYYTYEIPKLP